MTQELPLKVSRRQLREQALLASAAGIAEYAIVCDESNNSKEIDSKELYVDIVLRKPE